jgi:uncharacterized protein
MENLTKIPIGVSEIVLRARALVVSAASSQPTMSNPVFYCEIPVKDIDRAVAFYSAVFEFALERQSIDGNEMALFPYNPGVEGATGALARGESYTPSRDGARVYFSTSDMDATLGRAIHAGGKILYPKTDVGDYGFVAEFEDSEGNRIALHMKKG